MVIHRQCLPHCGHVFKPKTKFPAPTEAHVTSNLHIGANGVTGIMVERRIGMIFTHGCSVWVASAAPRVGAVGERTYAVWLDKSYEATVGRWTALEV